MQRIKKILMWKVQPPIALKHTVASTLLTQSALAVLFMCTIFALNDSKFIHL